jgi:hypothetical protein
MILSRFRRSEAVPGPRFSSRDPPSGVGLGVLCSVSAPYQGKSDQRQRDEQQRSPGQVAPDRCQGVGETVAQQHIPRPTSRRRRGSRAETCAGRACGHACDPGDQDAQHRGEPAEQHVPLATTLGAWSPCLAVCPGSARRWPRRAVPAAPAGSCSPLGSCCSYARAPAGSTSNAAARPLVAPSAHLGRHLRPHPRPPTSCRGRRRSRPGGPTTHHPRRPTPSFCATALIAAHRES